MKRLLTALFLLGTVAHAAAFDARTTGGTASGSQCGGADITVGIRVLAPHVVMFDVTTNKQASIVLRTDKGQVLRSCHAVTSCGGAWNDFQMTTGANSVTAEATVTVDGKNCTTGITSYIDK